jgi:mono/diheme cytochrome c family protein
MHRHSLNSSIVVLLGAALLAQCSRSPTQTNPPPDATLSGSVQPIFTANCATSSCHIGATAPAGMDLSQGQAYANIVNVASAELTTMLRVDPGQPDSSYLVHKIQGTHLTVGGIRARMPLNKPPLSDQDIARVRAWVSAGAPNN